MKELVEYILKNIVNHPDDVEVTIDETEDENIEDMPVSIHVKVNEEDKGLVIGREGKTINAIRTILAVQARRKIALKVD